MPVPVERGRTTVLKYPETPRPVSSMVRSASVVENFQLRRVFATPSRSRVAGTAALMKLIGVVGAGGSPLEAISSAAGLPSAPTAIR